MMRAPALRERPGVLPDRPLTAVGERAHYVLVTEHGWQLRRSLWGASALLGEVVAGQPYVLRQFADRDGGDWLDHADAGLLVDTSRRVLLFFSAARQAQALDLRAALFAVLQRVWPGWTVRWAYGGTAELMAYVGVEDPGPPADLAAHARTDLAAHRRRPARSGPGGTGWYRAPWWSDAIGTLVTVRHAAGDVLIHPLDLVHTPLWAGPSLVGRMPPGVRELATSSWPVCGMHLDLGRRAVGLWTAGTFPGWHGGAFESAWSGWDVTFWEDRLDAQLQACAGAVLTPPIRVPSGVVRLAHLLADAWSEPPDAPHLAWLRGLEPAVAAQPLEGVSSHARAEMGAAPTAIERRTIFTILHSVAVAAR